MLLIVLATSSMAVFAFICNIIRALSENKKKGHLRHGGDVFLGATSQVTQFTGTYKLFLMLEAVLNIIFSLFVQGQLTADVRGCGITMSEEHCSDGTVVTAYVPKGSSLMQQLEPYKLSMFKFQKYTAMASAAQP